MKRGRNQLGGGGAWNSKPRKKGNGIAVVQKAFDNAGYSFCNLYVPLL